MMNEDLAFSGNNDYYSQLLISLRTLRMPFTTFTFWQYVSAHIFRVCTVSISFTHSQLEYIHPCSILTSIYSSVEHDRKSKLYVTRKSTNRKRKHWVTWVDIKLGHTDLVQSPVRRHLMTRKLVRYDEYQVMCDISSGLVLITWRSQPEDDRFVGVDLQQFRRIDVERRYSKEYID